MTTTAWLTKDGGWGRWIRVEVADTPAADKAAADFFRRVCAYTIGENYHAAHVDESSQVVGKEMSDYFFPTCEHQMSLHLCYGPDHYPRDDQM